MNPDLQTVILFFRVLGRGDCLGHYAPITHVKGLPRGIYHGEFYVPDTSERVSCGWLATKFFHLSNFWLLKGAIQLKFKGEYQIFMVPHASPEQHEYRWAYSFKEGQNSAEDEDMLGATVSNWLRQCQKKKCWGKTEVRVQTGSVWWCWESTLKNKKNRHLFVLEVLIPKN